jgi:hypothetical protein
VTLFCPYATLSVTLIFLDYYLFLLLSVCWWPKRILNRKNTIIQCSQQPVLCFLDILLKLYLSLLNGRGPDFQDRETDMCPSPSSNPAHSLLKKKHFICSKKLHIKFHPKSRKCCTQVKKVPSVAIFSDYCSSVAATFQKHYKK